MVTPLHVFLFFLFSLFLFTVIIRYDYLRKFISSGRHPDYTRASLIQLSKYSHFVDKFSDHIIYSNWVIKMTINIGIKRSRATKLIRLSLDPIFSVSTDN